MAQSLFVCLDDPSFEQLPTSVLLLRTSSCPVLHEAVSTGSTAGVSSTGSTAGVSITGSTAGVSSTAVQHQSILTGHILNRHFTTIEKCLNLSPFI